MNLPNYLRRDLEAALSILGGHFPGQAHQIHQFRRAMENASTTRLLPQRLKILIDNCFGGGHQLSQEEQYEIGHALLALEEFARTGKPGARAMGREYRLMIYLDGEQNDWLRSYVERRQTSRAQAVRDALKLLRDQETDSPR